jgi:PAS domain S-box-containing protein
LVKPIKLIIAPLVSTIILVALVAVTSFWSFRQTQSALEARKNTYELIIRANGFLSELKDAETGQRGYLLTGDETFLRPYRAANDSVRAHLDDLRAHTSNSDAAKLLAPLPALVDIKLSEMAQAIELRHRQNSAGAAKLVSSGEGKRAMDAIRAGITSFNEIENGNLRQRDEELRSSMRQLLLTITFASLLSLLFLFVFAYFMYRERQQRQKDVGHIETQGFLHTEEEANRQLRLLNTTLQVSEAKTLVTLNSIGDAVIVTDGAGLVTLINPVAERLTGWTLAAASNRPVEEIFHIINQETREPSTVPVVATLAHGTIQGLANHTMLIARDGSECNIADSCAPIRDSTDQVVGAVLVFRDVTDEYAVQQALRDSTALIEAILNTAADGIITLHASGGIIERSNSVAERMFGYSASELVGQHFHMLIPELDQDLRNGSLTYYAASEEARAVGLGREVVGRRKDGNTFPLEIAVSETWLGGKRYFTGILRDVTLRKRIEAERNEALVIAESANRAKTDFLSSMSHELRTPLNAILGFTQLIESGTPAPTSTQQKSLAQILTAGWYLLELINEILDLALIESGVATMSREPVSLVEVMLECRTMIEPQASKRGIRMTFPRFDVSYYVNADRTRLKQVLINLLYNAIKYNKASGEVTVTYSLSPPDSIRISIRDIGSGLAPEQLDQLFQPFNRLGKETGVEEGTGIGLVVTKRLVELMDGKIGVESTVGVGTVFWIELGLTIAPRLASLEDEHALLPRPSLPKGTAQRTVLYVEDNPANMDLVEQLIARRPDLRLLAAADGALGIEFARIYLPDVILMDINLPGISGLEAMQLLRADGLTAHIPIIALSANAVPRDIDKGLAAGFFNYITKPIKVNQFMDALDAALKFAASPANLKKGKKVKSDA